MNCRHCHSPLPHPFLDQDSTPPSKQGKCLPASHVSILLPSALETRRLDFLLILPWNIADQIRTHNAHLAKQGTLFVTAVPELRIL